MFAHNKRLQYTVRVSETNPGLANLMLEQFGGPQGELAAACRYFTQALAEDDPGRKDMLMDIATEELSHLEVIGTIVAMLNKGAKGRLAEGMEAEADMYRAVTGAGNDSHLTQVLYGGGPPLTNSAGVPWSAGLHRHHRRAHGRSALQHRRRSARQDSSTNGSINCTDDPGVKEALGFLMTREISHQKSFEKALYAITPNFPPGKNPGDPRFASLYVNTSQGEADMRGPWNSDENFEYLHDREQQMALDGDDGGARVELDADEAAVVNQAALRTSSDPHSDPVTGVDLGQGAAVSRELGTADDVALAKRPPRKATGGRKPAK